MDPYTCAKVRHDTFRAFRFRACVTLRTKSVYSASFFLFLGVLATRYSQGSWTDFDAKYAETRGREHKIEYFDPYFHELVPFWGSFFDGTYGDAPLKTFLSRHRRSIKVA